jgi:prepilin-type N-terminal cleavage/methylation domain-containing protein
MKRTRGFSLVELLVVMGIIALLAALVTPSLSKAKEIARRGTCLSNLHSLHNAYATYAEAFSDQIPVGFTKSFQYNYMAYTTVDADPSIANKWVMFGVLYTTGYMTGPAAFYCPSAQLPGECLNGPLNPWPTSTTTWNSTQQTRVGYSCRPTDPIDPSIGYYWQVGGNGNFPGHLPKLGNYNHKALLTDRTSEPITLATFHVTCLNVIFGDGGGETVPSTVVTSGPADLDNMNYPFADSHNNVNIQNIFNQLDRWQ